MGKKGNFYINPATYSISLNSNKSQKVANARHALKESYGVPEMFKDLGHGVGKAYSEMNTYNKGLFWLFMFSMGGVVADNVANEGKYTKAAKDKLDNVYKSIVKNTPAVVIGADSPTHTLVPTPAPTVAANGSAVATPYEFTPGIEIIGSDAYKEHIEAQLEELDKTPNFKIRGMTARQYVEKYLDYLYEAVPGTLENCPKEAYGKKATECLAINFSDASMLLHVARHADQFSGELREEFKNKPVYEYEKDAVTVQVEWIAEKLNLNETKKNELFESIMKKYKP